MLGFSIQYGGSASGGASGLLAPLLFVVGGAVVGALLLPIVRILVVRSRASLNGWRARRRRIVAAAGAERRARAMMSELCPYGWHAQLTLYEGASAARESVRDAVALDWFELRPGGGVPAVMRRVWAGSVGEALEAMVADRRMDEALEQIELRASADGALWPES